MQLLKIVTLPPDVQVPKLHLDSYLPNYAFCLEIQTSPESTLFFLLLTPYASKTGEEPNS
eukprot:918393-Pelagomonas_calceolata.AAC.1